MGTVVVGLSTAAAEERPPLERLIQLNGERLFGGETHVEGERITVSFKKAEQFARAFEGPGMIRPEDLKGANHAMLDKVEHPLGAGRGDGEWLSRFELTGDVEATFKLKIPNIQKGSQLTLWLNKSQKSALQTSFFQNAALLVGGKARKRVSSGKEFQAPPEKWFEKKEPVGVALSVKGGKFSVRLKKDEVLSLDEVTDAPGGRIGFSFHKLSFVVSDLTVSGKFDRAWCEGQIKELDAKGSLAIKEKPAPEPTPQETRRSLKRDRDGGDPAARKKEAEEQL
jgi:hypothetical protein